MHDLRTLFAGVLCGLALVVCSSGNHNIGIGKDGYPDLVSNTAQIGSPSMDMPNPQTTLRHEIASWNETDDAHAMFAVSDSVPKGNAYRQALTYPYNGGVAHVPLSSANGYPLLSQGNDAQGCPGASRELCCSCGGGSCHDPDHSAPGVKCPYNRRSCQDPANKGKPSHFCKWIGPKLTDGDAGDDTGNSKAYQSTKTTWGLLTRQEIVKRGLGWVAMGFEYCHGDMQDCYTLETCAGTEENCPSRVYKSVCNGLVAMAWRTPSRHNTPPSNHYYEVDCKEMLPGDAVHYISHPVGHWVLFREYTDSSKKNIRIWQMGGGNGKANQWWRAPPSGLGPSRCYRRCGIKGENNKC